MNQGMNQTGPDKIDNKVFFRTVGALVVPMALQNLINVGVQSADVVMLGAVGEGALSAVSLAGTVQFLLMLIFFGLSSGASVLTAQYWGKGDVRTIEKVTGIALRLAILVGFVFFLAALLFPAALMRVFTPEAGIIADGARYLRIVAPCYLTTSVTILYLNIIRSVEKVVISTVVYSISLVVNVAFNAIFIFGLFGLPAMGVAGAALATTLARVLELFIVLVYARRIKPVRLRAKDLFTHDKPLFGDFIRYALPTTINELLWGLGVTINVVIIGHMGSAAVAANSVAQVVRQLATVVSFGLANAAAILVGKALGAGEPGRAQTYARRLLHLSLISGGCGAVLIFLLRLPVAGAMNLSPAADGYLRFLLLIMTLYVVLQSFNATSIVGIFRGGGDTRFGLVADAGSMWCFSIPFAAIAAFVLHWPVEAVFAILLMDEVIKVPMCLWRYGTRRWLRNVTR